MKALLLAAGYGTRLRPLTNEIPKCLIRINGKPILQYWIEKLAALGVKKFLVNTHYLPKKVEGFIAGLHRDYDIQIFHEKILLGTAGTILANSDFFEEDSFVVHADTWIEDELCDFLYFHERKSELAYSAVGFDVEDPSDYGTFIVDDNDTIVEFVEKSPDSPSLLANAACYLVRPKFVTWIQSLGPSITDLSVDVMVKSYGIGGVYKTEGAVFDIGTLESLKACRWYVSGAKRRIS